MNFEDISRPNKEIMHSIENRFPILLLIILLVLELIKLHMFFFYQRILLFFVYYQIVSYPSFTVEITKKSVSSRHLLAGIIIFKVSV